MQLAVSQCSALGRPVQAPRPARRGVSVVCQAGPKTEQKKGPLGLGDVLGPIGITVGKDVHLEEAEPAEAAQQQQQAAAAGSAKPKKQGAAQAANKLMDAAGVSLGPIGLTIGSDLRSTSVDEEDGAAPSGRPKSYASLTTAEWRELYEKDGAVDLWVQEEFNSGSRLVGGSAVWRGGVAGYTTGEGPGLEGAVRHKVRITNRNTGQEMEVEVPEDRYILYAAEEEGMELPFACRQGCCSECTVKVKSGTVTQPQSLGLSKALREQGYALMCVARPASDCVLETVPEGEAYMLQFGAPFEENALDPNAPSVERDDFAIELAMLDE